MVNAAVEHAFLKLDESYGFIRQLTRSELELLFTDPPAEVVEETHEPVPEARVNEDLDDTSRHQDPLPPAAIPDHGPVVNIGDPPKLPPAVPITETPEGSLGTPVEELEPIEPAEGNSIVKETAPVVIPPTDPVFEDDAEVITEEELREDEEAKRI